MRSDFSLAFLFSLLLTPSAATLRAPESFLPSSTSEGDHEHGDRDLFSSLLFGGCKRALTTCQEATGSATALPTEAWVAQLESMDPSVADPYVAELNKIVLAANQPDSDFANFMNGIKNNVKPLTMISLVREARALNGVQPEQALQNIMEILTSLKDMARQSPGFTEVLVYAIEFTARLLELLASDPTPVAIAFFVVKEIIKFLVTFVINSARVSVLRADPDCPAQLVACSYNQMMLNAVPSLMQSVATAKAEGLLSSSSSSSSSAAGDNA